MTIGQNAVHPHLSLYSIKHYSLRLWFTNSGAKNLNTRILLGVSKLKDLCKKRSNSYLLLLDWHYMIYVEDVNNKKDIHNEIFRNFQPWPDSVPVVFPTQAEVSHAHCISKTHILFYCSSHFLSCSSDALWNNLQGWTLSVCVSSITLNSILFSEVRNNLQDRKTRLTLNSIFTQRTKWFKK